MGNVASACPFVGVSTYSVDDFQSMTANEYGRKLVVFKGAGTVVEW